MNLESEIELEFNRTPEILDAPVESWERINLRLCQLIYQQRDKEVIEGRESISESDPFD